MEQKYATREEELELIEKIKASTTVIEVDEVYGYTMDDIRYILDVNFDKIFICSDEDDNNLVPKATYLLDNSIYQVVM